MPNPNPIFILIDDDLLNNMVCKMTIRNANKDIEVVSHNFPENGLAYILDTFLKDNAPKGILLLDINMPILSGWEVLDKLNSHFEKIKNNLSIYMLSSSIDHSDKANANNHPLVSGFIEKPLSTNAILMLLKEN